METGESEVEVTVSDIDDPGVVEALKAIAKNDPDGLIQPAVVVDEAEDPESPLHRYFEWDDTEAARAYRLVQARSLIARVRVNVKTAGPQLVNVVIRTGETARRGYVPIERAVTEPDLYEQIVADAYRGITMYRNRLSAFEQAQNTLTHLDAALNEMKASPVE